MPGKSTYEEHFLYNENERNATPHANILWTHATHEKTLWTHPVFFTNAKI